MDIPHLADDAAARRRAPACGAGYAAPPEGTDAHWDYASLPALPPGARTLFADSPPARCDYSSRLLTMADGTRIAVDVQLPCGLPPGAPGAPFHCVLVQSRYGRAWRLRWPYNKLWGGRPVDIVYFLFKARLAATHARALLLRIPSCGRVNACLRANARTHARACACEALRGAPRHATPRDC
jgi:hypothetical protein